MTNTTYPFSPQGLKLRWLNVQSYEIKLSNGKVILFDPQLSDPVSSDDRAKYYRIPERFHLDKNSVERVDYLILNHSHCDHLIDLGYFVHKFNPLVICHQCAAYELAKAFDIPFTSIYPVGDQEMHAFEDFTLYTFHGSHMPQDFIYSSMPNIMEKSYGVNGVGMHEIGHLGGIFNMNYGICTRENLRLGFWAGRMDQLAYPVLKQLADFRPNVLLRQIPTRLPEQAADILAEELQALGAQLMLPMHHEMFEIQYPDFLPELFSNINQQLEQRSCTGRALLPVRGEWYQIGVCMSPLQL